MSNARLSVVSLLFLSLLLHLAVSAPSPSPLPSPSLSPSPSVHAPNLAPASSPLASSPPPALSPGSSPSTSPADRSSINIAGVDADDRAGNSSRGGLSGSKKAGLAIGVIVAASVILLAGMVYKKRNQNIRHSQYAYAARREFL